MTINNTKKHLRHWKANLKTSQAVLNNFKAKAAMGADSDEFEHDFNLAQKGNAYALSQVLRYTEDLIILRNSEAVGGGLGFDPQ